MIRYRAKDKFSKLNKSFVIAEIVSYLPSLLIELQLFPVLSDQNNSFLLVMGASPLGHQALETPGNSENGDHLACCNSA